MSKGSTIVPVRVPADLLAAFDAAVASERRGEPWTRSSFLLHALRMELSRRERARTWRIRKSKKAEGGTDDGQY